MLVLYIVSCLVLGFIAAMLGLAEGLPLWVVLGSYVLGGALGVITSAMGVMLITLVAPSAY